MLKAFKYIAFSLIILNFSCKKSEPVTAAQCANTITTEYTTALNAWVADPSNNTKCKNVVDILGKLINCPGVPAASKADYQKLLNDSPCK